MKKVEAKWKLASRKPPKKGLAPLPTFICCLASFSLVKRHVLKLLSKLRKSVLKKRKQIMLKFKRTFLESTFVEMFKCIALQPSS